MSKHNIETFLKEAVGYAIPPSEKTSRLKDTTELKARPESIKPSSNAGFASYKMSKENAIRPGSRIRKHWEAPVILHAPVRGKNIPALSTITKHPPSFDLPVRPQNDAHASRGRRRSKSGGVANRRNTFVPISSIQTELCEGNRPAALNEKDISSLTVSERLGANYSIQTLGMSPRLLHQNGSRDAYHDILKKRIDKQWQIINSSEIQENQLFLHLDSSKLPLWTFDQGEPGSSGAVFVSDNSNTQNSFAQAKLYKDGRWTWQPCRILKYNSISALYTVKFVGTKISKQLRRMHIIFSSDEQSRIEDRVARAEKEREHTKMVLRFLHYIDMQDEASITGPSRQLQKSILEKISFRPSFPFNDEGNQELGKLVLEFRDQYILSQKKSCAIYNLMHPINDPLRYFLKLPAPNLLLPIRDHRSFDRAGCIRGSGVLKDISLKLARNALFLRDDIFKTMAVATNTWYPHFEEVGMFESHVFIHVSDVCLQLVRHKRHPAPITGIEGIHLAEVPQGGYLVSTSQHKKSLNHIFRRKRLFILRQAAIENVVDFNVFLEIQKLHVDAVIKQLTNMWRLQIVNTIQSLHLRKKGFDFYTTKASQLDRRVFRIVKRLNMEMRDQLTRLVLRSFKEWSEYFEVKVLNDHEANFGIRAFHQKSIASAIESEQQQKGGISSDWCLPLVLNPPTEPSRFDVYLHRTSKSISAFTTTAAKATCSLKMVIDMNEEADHYVSFLPRLKGIKRELSDTLEYGFDQCKALEYIDSDILQFLAPEGHSVLGANKSHLLEALEGTRQHVASLVDKKIKNIEYIAQLYREFSSILLIDEEELTNHLFFRLRLIKPKFSDEEVAKQKSLETKAGLFNKYTGGTGPVNIQSEIRRFVYLSDEIKRKTFNEEHIGMFIVDCSDVKNIIAAKADSIVKSISTALLQDAEETYQALVADYTDISEALKQIPESEQEVSQLRSFLETCPAKVVELKRMHEATSKRIQSLGEFNIRESYDCMVTYWELLQWPYTVEAMCGACATKCSMVASKLLKIIHKERVALDQTVTDLRHATIKFRKVGGTNDVGLISGEAASLQGLIDNAYEKAVELTQRETDLGEDPNAFAELDNIMKNFSPFFHLWTSLSDALEDLSVWKEGSLWSLEPDNVVKKVNNWIKETLTLLVFFRNERFREPTVVAEYFNSILSEFRIHLPLIRTLLDPAFADRHWVEISTIVGYEINPAISIPFETVLSKDTGQFLKDIARVLSKAKQEMELDIEIKRIERNWDDMAVQIAPCTATKVPGFFIVEDFLTLFEELDHLILCVDVVLMSEFIGPLNILAEDLQQTLIAAQALLRAWESFQEMWITLFPLFDSDDSRGIIPIESRQFSRLENSWKRAMHEISRDRDLSNIAAQDSLLPMFQSGLEEMEYIFETKRTYFSVKRAQYPRLYLLDDANLLRLLSEKEHLDVANDIIGRIFPGATSIVVETFETTNEMPDGESNLLQEKNRAKHSCRAEICALRGFYGDELKLVNGVQFSLDTFPEWLSILEKEMKASVLSKILDLESSIEHRTLNANLQTNVIQDKILWTHLTKDGILHKNVDSVLRHIADDMRCLLVMLRNKKISGGKAVIQSIHSMIAWKLHARDVTKDLLDTNVTSVDSYDWLKVQRYGIVNDESQSHCDDSSARIEDCDDKRSNVFVRLMSNTTFYGNEYMGTWSHIIIDPMTDRCQRVLVNAFFETESPLMWGPAGGSSKSSIFTALASSIGIGALTVPCSPDMPVQTFTDHICGIASSGMWFAFRRCEKVVAHVASIVAQYLSEILLAKRAEIKSFSFDGVGPIQLHSHSYITFISDVSTLGRKDLPRAMSMAFRPLHINPRESKTTLALILRIYGHSKHEKLPNQMDTFFEIYNNNFLFLCTARLNKAEYFQCAIQMVLDFVEDPLSISLAETIVQVIHDRLCLTILSSLYNVFVELIKSIFQVDVKTIDESLSSKFDRKTRRLSYFSFTGFISSCLKLDISLQQSRKIILLYGNHGCGKSSVKHCVLTDEYVEDSCIYADAMNYEDLIGSFGTSCVQSWKDGLLGSLFRKRKKEKGKKIVTTIDCNGMRAWMGELLNIWGSPDKYLVLPSGETINFNRHIIFEVCDLESFSPNDLSGCSLVHVQDSPCIWQGLVYRWIHTHRIKFSDIKSFSKRCEALFEWILPPLIEQLEEYFLLDVSHLVASMLAIFDGKLCVALVQSNLTVYNPALKKRRHVSLKLSVKFSSSLRGEDTCKKRTSEPVQSDDQGESFDALEALFMWSVIWGIGQNISVAGKEIFNDVFRKLAAGKIDGGFSDAGLASALLEQRATKLAVGLGGPILRKLKIPLPTDLSLFEVDYNVQRGKWSKILFCDGACAPSDIPNYENFAIVSNTGSVSSLVNVLTQANQNVLMIGPENSGKSYSLRHLLTGLCGVKNKSFVEIPVGRESSTNVFKQIVESDFKLHGHTACKSRHHNGTVVFIDDLEIRESEYERGSVQEIIRQAIDTQSWFHKGVNANVSIGDCSFHATITVNEHSKLLKEKRLLRHFIPLFCDALGDGDIKAIAAIYLKNGHLSELRLLKIFSSALSELYSNFKNCKLFDQRGAKVFDLHSFCYHAQLFAVSIPKDMLDTPKLLWQLWTHHCSRDFRDAIRLKSGQKIYDKEILKIVGKYSASTSFASIVSDDPYFLYFHDASGKYIQITTDEREKQLKFIQDEFTIPVSLVSTSESLYYNAVRISYALENNKTSPVFLVGEKTKAAVDSVYFAASLREYSLLEPKSFDEIFSLLKKDRNSSTRFVVFFRAAANFVNYFKCLTDPSLLYTRIFERVETPIHSLQMMKSFCDLFCPVIMVTTRELYEIETTIDICHSRFIYFKDSTIEEKITEEEALAKTLLAALPEKGKSSAFFNTSRFLHKNAIERPSSVVGAKPYINFVNAFVHISGASDVKISSQIPQYDKCIQSFNSVERQSVLSIERVESLNIQISTTRAAIDHAKAEVEDYRVQLIKAERKMSDIMEKINVYESRAYQLTETIEANLGTVIPLLEQSNLELKSISSADVTVLKKLEKPSPHIVLVIEAVCILLGVRPENGTKDSKDALEYVEVAKKKLFHSPQSFLEKIISYDRDSITDEILSVMSLFLEKKNFNSKSVKRQSGVCAILCDWARHLIMFAKISRTINPFQKELREVTAHLEASRLDIHKHSDETDNIKSEGERAAMELEEHLQRLQEFSNARSHQEHFSKTAGRILDAFPSTRQSWLSKRANLEGKLSFSFGDDILSSAFIAYAGPMTEGDRHDFLENILKKLSEANILHSPSFSLLQNMKYCVDSSVYKKIFMLDSYVRDSALITMKSALTVMFIDPLCQGIVVVESILKEPDTVSVWSGTKYFEEIWNEDRKDIPLIIEDIDTPSRLKEILQFLSIDPQKYRVRNKIFLSTRIFDFHVSEDLRDQLDIVRLGSSSSLSKQIQAMVLLTDSTKIKQMKETTERASNVDKHIEDVETKINQIFGSENVSGVYENISTLLDLAHQLKENEALKKVVVGQLSRLAAEEALWKPLLDCAASLSSLLLRLNKIDSSYRFSFDHLLMCIDSTIKQVKQQRHTKALVNKLVAFLCKSVFDLVVPSLLDKHRPVFSFLLIRETSLDQEDPLQTDLMNFLFSQTCDNASSGENIKPLVSVVPSFAKLLDVEEAVWSRLSLSKNISMDLDQSSFFIELFEESGQKYVDDEAEDGDGKVMSEENELSLKPNIILAKACILKCVSSDWRQLEWLLNAWIRCTAASSVYIDASKVTIGARIALAKNTTPIFVFQSSVRNSLGEIHQYAEAKNSVRRLKLCSLSRYDSTSMEELIMSHVDRGSWLVVTDCESVDETLQKICGPSLLNVDRSRADQDFRLILMVKPSTRGKWPKFIADKSIFIDCCYRRSLRIRIIHLYSVIPKKVYEPLVEKLGQNFADLSPVARRHFQKLVFCLAYFHTGITNFAETHDKLYEFSDETFKMALDELFAIAKDCGLSDLEQTRFLIRTRILESIYLDKVVELFDDVFVNELFRAIFVQCNWEKDKQIIQDEVLSTFPPTGRLDMNAQPFLEKIPSCNETETRIGSSYLGNEKKSIYFSREFVYALKLFYDPPIHPQNNISVGVTHQIKVMKTEVKSHESDIQLCSRLYINNKREPTVIVLSEFLNPRVPLVKLLYDFSTKHGIDFDDAGFQCCVTDKNDALDDADDGDVVFFEGLILHNAWWRDGSLIDVPENVDGVTRLPLVRCKICHRRNITSRVDQYLSPVVRLNDGSDGSSLTKDHVIFFVPLNTSATQDPESWANRRCFLSI